MTQSQSRQVKLNLRTVGLGIHIGRTNLYVTGVRNRFGRLVYTGHDVLENYREKTDGEIREFLEEFQREYKMKRGDAYLILPRGYALIQTADFPLEAQNNLDEAMGYQLSNLFPGNLEVYDFFPQVMTKADQLRVMILALKKEYMGQAFSLMRRWQLKIAGITLDSFAMLNGLAHTAPERFAKEKFAVLHFYQDGLELLASSEGRIQASHFFTFEEDEARRKEQIVRELEEGLSRARMDAESVDSWLWAGRVPDDLKAFLSEEIGIPYSEWQDMEGTAIPAEALPGFGGGVSALFDKNALNLNMLPSKLRKRHKRLPVILGVVAVIIMSLFFIGGEIQDYRALGREHRQLKARNEDLSARALELSNAKQAYSAVAKERDTFRRYEASDLTVRLLYHLSQQLPEHTYLTLLRIDNGTDLNIRGDSEDPIAVENILKNLDFLKDVKASRSGFTTSSRDPDGKKSFSIDATIVLEAFN